MDSISKRRCHSCGKRRRLESFSEDPERPDGIAKLCDICRVPKTCPECGVEKVRASFSRKQAGLTTDNRAAICKKCMRRRSQRCTRCKERWPLTQFRPLEDGTNGRDDVCRPCRRAAHNEQRLEELRQYGKDNLADAQAEAQKKQESLKRKRDRDALEKIGLGRAAPSRKLTTDLGITEGQARDLRVRILAAQDGKCAICGLKIGPEMRATLDHCHRRKTVRSVLCTRCNTGLGMFRDSPGLLQAAAAYLIRHEGAPTSLPSADDGQASCQSVTPSSEPPLPLP